MVDYLDSTIIETTSSGPVNMSQRTNDERHKVVLEGHGWIKTFKKLIF